MGGADQTTLAHAELKLGLVKRDRDGKLVVAILSTSVIDTGWVENTRPRRALAEPDAMPSQHQSHSVVLGGGATYYTTIVLPSSGVCHP